MPGWPPSGLRKAPADHPVRLHFNNVMLLFLLWEWPKSASSSKETLVVVQFLSPTRYVILRYYANYQFNSIQINSLAIFFLPLINIPTKDVKASPILVHISTKGNCFTLSWFNTLRHLKNKQKLTKGRGKLQVAALILDPVAVVTLLPPRNNTKSSSFPPLSLLLHVTEAIILEWWMKC